MIPLAARTNNSLSFEGFSATMRTMKNHKKHNNKNQTKFIWIAAGIVAVLILLFFLQSDSNSSVISITPPGGTAAVYIDRETVSPITSTSTPTTYKVSPGSHQVLVARDGYWPWGQQIDVAEGETVNVNPFLIEESGSRVLETPSAVTNALQEARNSSVPTTDAPELSPSGDIRVFIDSETNIIAQWTGSTSTAPSYFDCHEGTCGVSVFNQLPVRQIAFYPDRDDVIFFATDTGVYAIEIDPRGENQNFQPVEESIQSPVFTIANQQIFILSGERITVSGI